MPRLTCPKCGNDSFKISLTERQETAETIPQVTKMSIITILHITCAKCGWNKHLTRPPKS